MKLRPALIALVAASTLVFASNSFAAGKTSYDPTPPLNPDGTKQMGLIGIDSQPSEQLLNFGSYLLKFEGQPGSFTKVSTCKSYMDAECSGGSIYQARAELQPCTTSNPTDCFKSIIVKDSTGKDIAATLVTDKMAILRQNFTGSQSTWLPTGGNPLIYNIPGAPHASGSYYMVKPDVLLRLNQGETTFTLTKFEAGIYPIKFVPLKNIRKDANGNPLQSSASTDVKEYPDFRIAGGPNTDECDGGLNDGANCIFPEAFPEGFTFGMNLRLTHALYGWLHGRIFKANVAMTSNPASADGVDLSISGEPVAVPVIGGYVKSEGAPEKVLKYFTTLPRYGTVYGSGQSFDRNGPLNTISVLHQHYDPHEYTMAEFRDWLDVLGDKSAAEPSYWIVQTIIGGADDQVAKCTKDAKSLAGVVTTNATTYLPGPPAFDKAQGNLDYKVLAPHFKSDGSVMQGNYNLIMNTDLARCIYGFSNAPIGATVSVVASDGTNRVATTLVTQDAKFIKMLASGFEFSDPTVHVKITQDAQSVAPKPEPTPIVAPVAVATPTPKPQKATTITCVKGKVTKKVTSVNPKCPTGYKKK